MKLIVNGEARELENGAKLSVLLEDLALPSKRIAVEVNNEVIRRGDWPSQELTDGDRVEIVHFVGGG